MGGAEIGGDVRELIAEVKGPLIATAPAPSEWLACWPDRRDHGYWRGSQRDPQFQESGMRYLTNLPNPLARQNPRDGDPLLGFCETRLISRKLHLA